MIFIVSFIKSNEVYTKWSKKLEEIKRIIKYLKVEIDVMIKIAIFLRKKVDIRILMQNIQNHL